MPTAREEEAGCIAGGLSCRRMRLLQSLALALVVVGLIACGAAAVPTPTLTPAPSSTAAPSLVFSGFSVGFDTGSVPPPFNYTYSLDGTFAADALSVHYLLTYQFRDEVTSSEITSNGYTAHDDINWTGKLTGADLDTWRTLTAQTTLGPIPPLVPGAESFSVTLTPSTGEPQVGVPVNRDPWQAAITAIDKQARAATGATRTSP